MEDTFAFAAFRSRQQIMQFDSLLRKASIPSQIINTPHEVALGCGLSVRFNMENYEMVRAIYEANPSQSFVGFYRCRHKDMRLVCEPLMRRMHP